MKLRQSIQSVEINKFEHVKLLDENNYSYGNENNSWILSLVLQSRL